MNAARRLLAGVAVATLAACSLLPAAPPSPAVFDLGPLPPAPAPATGPALVQVTAPPWLDGQAMLYRLAYRDAARLSSYRDSRWAAPPAALLQERLRQRLAQAAEAPGAARLRLEVEKFCQRFDAPGSSHAVVRMRAALLEAGTGRVLHQRTFTEEVPAATADASGGAHALAKASDAALAAVIAWAAGAV